MILTHPLLARQAAQMSLDPNATHGCTSKCIITIVATVFGALAAVALGGLIYLWARRRRATAHPYSRQIDDGHIYDAAAVARNHARTEKPPPVPMKQSYGVGGISAGRDPIVANHHAYWAGSASTGASNRDKHMPAPPPPGI